MINPSLAMDRLEKRMKLLQVDFQRFFSGAIDQPPEDMANSIRNDLRSLRNMGTLSPSQSYRLGALEARFTSYSQLNQRRMRQQEIAAPQHPSRGSSPSPRRRRDPRQGVVVPAGSGGSEAVADLYEQLYPDGSGEARGISLDRFSSYLSQHVERIREKTGCSEVRVRVHEEGGHRKLNVHPLHPTSGGNPDDRTKASRRDDS